MKRITQVNNRKFYAFGDVHGEYDMMITALDYVLEKAQPQDLIVFLGDYIDRGPKSKEVLDRIIRLKKERENVKTLRGNHEQMMIDAPEYNSAFQMWFSNGGYQTVKSYDKYRDLDVYDWQNIVPKEHRDFVAATEMEHEEENFFFVHAGILPENVYWQMDGSGKYDARLWIRREFIYDNQDYGKIVVFGHTPQIHTKMPIVMKNKIGIDTGAVFGGKLSVLVIDENDRENFGLIQVDKENKLTEKNISTNDV